MTSEARRLDPDAFARWWEETGDYALRQILHWRWDPIGVSGDFPYAADEYDSYTPQVASALNTGASADDIAELLGAIEQDRMDLGAGSSDRLRGLGADILTWFESSRSRWVEFGPLRR